MSNPSRLRLCILYDPLSGNFSPSPYLDSYDCTVLNVSNDKKIAEEQIREAVRLSVDADPISLSFVNLVKERTELKLSKMKIYTVNIIQFYVFYAFSLEWSCLACPLSPH